MTHPLDSLFKPRGVAVIGASNKELSIGHRVVTNILENGYAGGVYPVHPKGGEILGLQAYRSVVDVPGDVDVANICIRNIFVPTAVEECGRKGVKNVIIHTAGFREVGGKGAELEDQIMEIAGKYGIRVYGPNSQGFMNSDPDVSLYANFTFTPMKEGTVSVLAQSGGVAEVLNLNLRERGMGFRLYASNGNARDISIPEILEYFGEDEKTKVILLHVESMKDPAAFIETVSKITSKKPVLAIKSGKTVEAASAIQSHTGSLMEADTLTDAILEKSGVLRFHSMQEMVDAAVAFGSQPLPKGRGVGIMTNAGGPGIISIDECVERGLELPGLAEETKQFLVENLPPEAYCENPIDTSATAGPAVFAATVKALAEDPNTDSLLINMITPFFVDCEGSAKAMVETLAEIGADKPVTGVVMTNENWGSTIDTFRDAGIPVYSYPETAAMVLRAMVRYAEMRAQADEKVETFEADTARARELLADCEGGNFIPGATAYEICRCYGLPVADFRLARTETDLPSKDDMPFPLALKVEAADVVHKTEQGGLLLNINSEEELRAGFRSLMDKFAGSDPAVLIQRQVPEGREVIIGGKREGSLPLLMMGLGGIYVEVLKDVAFKLAPISRQATVRAMESLKTYPLLAGVRGEAPCDIASITDIVMRIQQLMLDLPEIQELDLNPVIVYDEGKGASIVDARMRLR